MGLRFEPDALDSVPRNEHQRLLDKIEWLWANRSSINHNPLGENLSGYFKRRRGKYRIIYTYDPNPDEMVIHLVGHRDDIYEQLK